MSIRDLGVLGAERRGEDFGASECQAQLAALPELIGRQPPLQPQPHEHCTVVERQVFDGLKTTVLRIRHIELKAAPPCRRRQAAPYRCHELIGLEHELHIPDD